jgi:hypothetical protein
MADYKVTEEMTKSSLQDTMGSNVAVQLREMRPDVGFIHVDDLCGEQGLMGSFGRRVKEADKDGDGLLSKAEFRELFVSIVNKERKLTNLKVMAVFFTFFAIILIGANIGLSIATAQLSKEVKVSSITGLMTVKGNSSQVVSTGSIVSRALASGLADLDLSTPVNELVQFKNIVMGNGSSYDIYSVAGVHVRPQTEVEFFTQSGTVFLINGTGVFVDGTLATERSPVGGRRRLLRLPAQQSVVIDIYK